MTIVNDMKKLTIIIILCTCQIGMAMAQSSRRNLYEGRPMPDWIESPPIAHNSSYYFKVFDARDVDMEKARNQAIKKAFQQAMNFVSTAVNSADVYKAIEEGKNLDVISETYSIPIYVTCEFQKQRPDKVWVYWILCQIAVRGNVVPLFNTHFSECNTHDLWDEKKKQVENDLEKERKRVDGTALAASFFIPGAGQMYKGKGGVGAGILLGEMALVGGGVTCYFFGKKQLNVMRGVNVEYDAFRSAQQLYNTMRIVSYSCYGAAAALYIFNLCNAYMIAPSDRKFPQLTYNAAFIPVNEFTAPTYAMGASVQIKF